MNVRIKEIFIDLFVGFCFIMGVALISFGFFIFCFWLSN